MGSSAPEIAPPQPSLPRAEEGVRGMAEDGWGRPRREARLRRGLEMERIELAGISVEALIAGSGPPLLFLHGGDYVAQNRPFLDRLAQRFRVVAPRHPGFGTTPRPAWFRSVNDIAYLYLDLIDRLDLHRVTLVGSSFGGWVALELAVRSTARLGRLVLIDSLGLKFGGREERDIADIYALPADEALRRTFTDPARFVPDYAALDETELQAIAHDREATALYGWKPYMHNPALVNWLHRIAVPSLPEAVADHIARFAQGN
ncbi:MAG: alpha/beta hydrolase [Alphaproteobacteria bacterium]|nr:MAG: alpha/beta hydrolase [Alphaproteobacteria bacterium]